MSESPKIDEKLVKTLVSKQFPQWKDLLVRQVIPGGWDNRTFRLGEDKLVKLPSAAEYTAQVEKEYDWLPKLAPHLPLPIPKPLVIGEPTDGYPWRWVIYDWLPGKTASVSDISNLYDFARQLAQFLKTLQGVDSTHGLLPGAHNFYRGEALSIYDAETRQAIALLKNQIDTDVAIAVWEEALNSIWSDSPVWVHGDVSAGNLLVQNGQLSAVIDFGLLAIGDPACDLAIAWTLLENESRQNFFLKLELDVDTWNRGRGWALWKAVITAARLSDTNVVEKDQCWRIITEIISDFKKTHHV